MSSEPERNHEWDIIGNLIVSRTLSGRIPDEVFDRYIAEMEAADLNTGISLCWGTQNVSATQRAAVSRVMSKKNMKGIVVTDSRMTRGVVTAVSWLGAKIAAFSWDDLDGAMNAIQASDETRARVKAIAEGFRQSQAGSGSGDSGGGND